MKKSLLAFVALLLVAAIYIPATADTTAPKVTAAPVAAVGVSSDYNPIVSPVNVSEQMPWKSSERYGFLYIDGYQETYNPEENIVFSIEGKSDKLYVEKSSGFDVAATILDLSRNVGKRAKVEYDAGRRTWQIKLTAPMESAKEYKVVLNLFCKKKDSPCSETYGFGTQMDKILPLNVR